MVDHFDLRAPTVLDKEPGKCKVIRIYKDSIIPRAHISIVHILLISSTMVINYIVARYFFLITEFIEKIDDLKLWQVFNKF